jgi:hypothetical protein
MQQKGNLGKADSKKLQVSSIPVKLAIGTSNN